MKPRRPTATNNKQSITLPDKINSYAEGIFNSVTIIQYIKSNLKKKIQGLLKGEKKLSKETKQTFRSRLRYDTHFGMIGQEIYNS